MSSKPFIARFMDGRDAVGTPWESEGPDSPVFVKKFIGWEGKPFVFATDGSLFRMLPSSDSNSPYRLEMADDDPAGSDILFKGSTIPESDAIALL
jgi:hypothetical protein